MDVRDYPDAVCSYQICKDHISTGRGRGGSKARARSASKDQAWDRLIKFEIEIEVRYLRASGRRVATNGLLSHFMFRMVELSFTVSLCTALSLRPAYPGLGQTLLKPRGNFWRVRKQRTALIGIEHPLPCGFEMCFAIVISLPPSPPMSQGYGSSPPWGGPSET